MTGLVFTDVGRVLRPVLKMYLDLHRHPELSGCESRTAGRFQAAIASAGFGVRAGVGGHGVVGVLANGDGPTVMLRAELDALPLPERTGLAYASRVRAVDADGTRVPVMHACGHDIHVAAVTGAGMLLARAREQWRGTLVLVGQPAEETLTGARAMLADGLYERFPRPDVVLGQHVSPLPAGTVAHARGPVIAESAVVEVVVRGHGGHAAAAAGVVSPVDIAAAVIPRLKRLSLVAGPGEPEPVVINVGTLRAGARANIIPDQAVMTISVRGYSGSRLTSALAAIREAVRGECAAAPGSLEPQVSVTTRAPGGGNDPRLGAVVRAAHQDAFGDKRLTPWWPVPIAEDFPLFGPAGAGIYGGPAIPSVYWMIGGTARGDWAAAAGDPGQLAGPHSPRFAPDPVPTLRVGISALAEAAGRVLSPRSRDAD